MRLLIIHDRPEIASELVSLIQATGTPHCRIDTAFDLMTGRDLLRSNYYDLAVIDLTLPVVVGMAADTLENVNILLRSIFSGGDFKVPADILGISKDTDALALIRNDVGEHLMGVVHEDTDGRWKKAVAAKVRYVANSRRSRRLVGNSAYEIDLVIITALDKEALPYGGLFELAKSEELDGGKEFVFKSCDEVMRRGLLFAVGKSGQAPTASMTQALLTQFRPRLILMTGFCGGVAERVNQGDLLAFTSAHAWDYGKWAEIKTGDETKKLVFQARPGALNVDEKGVDRLVRGLIAEGYKPSDAMRGAVSAATKEKLNSWKLKRTAAGSGSAVVTSLDVLQQITGLDENIWAIDMESYGFYYACRNTPVVAPDFICIKSVADFCNGEKSSEFHEGCSLIAASFAHELVTKHYPFGQS